MRAALGIIEGRGLSFLLCEFNPVERKIHIWENWLIFLGIWGEPELILRIWGANEKYFQGADIFFMDFGRSMHYIIFRDQGSTDPPSPGGLDIGMEFSNSKNLCWPGLSCKD